VAICTAIAVTLTLDLWSGCDQGAASDQTIYIEVADGDVVAGRYVLSAKGGLPSFLELAQPPGAAPAMHFTAARVQSAADSKESKGEVRSSVMML